MLVKKIYCKTYSILKDRMENIIVNYPNLFLKLLIKIANINSLSKRHLRAKLLRKYSNLLSQIINEINFEQGLFIKSDKIYVIDNNDIKLNCIGTNRYFKVPKGRKANEGEELANFLNKMQIRLKHIIDIGANYGEISIFFSKRFPSSKIISVEASPDNFKVFLDNISVQSFDTRNIIPLNYAISDSNGKVKTPKGYSSEHSIIRTKAKTDYYSVESKTLSALIEEQKITTIDFLKVDIEGSEPLMTECLKNNLKNIKTIFIEFSQKNEVEKYLALMRILFENHFKCFKHNSNSLLSHTDAKALFLDQKSIDFWFVNPKVL